MPSNAESKTETFSPFNIAVIGAGVVGLHVALGLIRRNIRVTVYEQATEHKDIGAGLGFFNSTVACMEEIDPQIATAIKRVAIKGGQVGWTDGLTQEDLTKRPADRLHDVLLPDLGEHWINYFCHRGMVLEELVKCMPEGTIQLSKRVESIVREEDIDGVTVRFTDATVVKVDAVIGCDGVRSRVRQQVLSPDDPAGVSHYAHESAYRCIVEMEKVRPFWNNLAEHPVMFTGKGAHIFTYPIAGHKFLNVAACIRDDNAWPDDGRHSVKASKSEMVEAFSSFGPTVRSLFELVPEEQSRWGLFDTLDHPLKTYAFGPIALAGDAAHASTPHHGAGACMGVEDALVLSVLLEKAARQLKTATNEPRKSEVLAKAFQVYDTIRRPRSQWVVESSRLQGQVVKGETPEIASTAQSFLQHAIERYGKICTYDWKEAVARAVSLFE